MVIDVPKSSLAVTGVLFLRRKATPWVFWVASEWGISYAGVSGFFVLMKQDVNASVRKFLTCQERPMGSTASVPGFLVASDSYPHSSAVEMCSGGELRMEEPGKAEETHESIQNSTKSSVASNETSSQIEMMEALDKG